jgi:hypothetical protein
MGDWSYFGLGVQKSVEVMEAEAEQERAHLHAPYNVTFYGGRSLAGKR